MPDGIVFNQQIKVWGQPNFNSNGFDCTAYNLKYPRGVSIYNDTLIITDYGNNRVLLYNLSDEDTVADRVFGQPDFTSNASGNANFEFSTPGCAIINSDTLYVLDIGNNRVMGFDLYDGDSVADVIFEASVSDGIEQGMDCKLDTLYVVSFTQILVFSLIDGDTIVDVTYQLGGTGSDVKVNNTGETLWVTDANRNLILKYSLRDGNTDADDTYSGGGKTGAYNIPKGLAVIGNDTLFLVESGNYRTFAFALDDQMEADKVFGQTSFTSNFRNSDNPNSFFFDAPTFVAVDNSASTIFN